MGAAVFESSRRIALSLSLVVVSCAAAPAWARERRGDEPQAGPRGPSIEESIALRRPRGAGLSPDGRSVLYRVSRVDWGDNTFRSRLWLADVESGRRTPLTFGEASVGSVDWSPDGRWISFTSDRGGGRSQLYFLSPTGGEAWQVSNAKSGVGGYEWSPDGRRIAFTARDSAGEAKKDEKRGDFFEVDAERTPRHLWVIEVPDEAGGPPVKPRRLTSGNAFSVGGYRWSPDSSCIAFTGTVPPRFAWDSSDIFVVDLPPELPAATDETGDAAGESPHGTVRRLVDTPGPDSSPIWSPDGSRVAYSTSAGAQFFYYANSEIAVVPAAGGAPRVVSRAFDEDARPLEWTPRGILFSALERTGSHLYRLDPEDEAVTRLTGPDRGSWRGFSFDRTFRHLACVGGLPNEFAEVQVSALEPFQPRALTEFAVQCAKFDLATREVVHWTSRDGTEIEGVLLRPATLEPGRRYPLLVRIHGGPTGVDGPLRRADSTYPLERFVARGALVLMPNYRGSAGYGAEFRALNVRNLGIGDAWDVLSGVDALVERGIADGERVGAMGWSQGGYISAFLCTWCDRFRAVSVGAGISNWVTYYVNTDIHTFTRQYLRATPWDDPEIYRRTSPIGYVERARTPALIQHGELDRRVPIPNAYELFQALQDREVPVKMFVYRGFGHGVWRPREQRDLMEQNERWFGRWIWGDDQGEGEEL